MICRVRFCGLRRRFASSYAPSHVLASFFLASGFLQVPFTRVDLRRWKEEGAIGGFWWKEEATSEWSSGHPNPRRLSLEFPSPPCELKSDFNDLYRMYFLTSSSDRFGFTSLGVSGCARGGCVCFLCCRWRRPGPSRSLSSAPLFFSRVVHMSAKRLVQDFCKVRPHSRSLCLWIPTVLLVIHFDSGAIQYRCFRLC